MLATNTSVVTVKTIGGINSLSTVETQLIRAATIKKQPAYNNIFYFFDCDFKKIVKTDVEKYVCFSKTAAYDTANRMLYAGVPEDKLTTYDVEDDFDLIFEDLDKLESKI